MAFILSESKKRFLASDEAKWATEQLQLMVDDDQYITPSKSIYVRAEMHTLSYIEWNLMYLCEHPQTRVNDYLSNQRLRSKIRSQGR